jgi:hypothetical protein
MDPLWVCLAAGAVAFASVLPLSGEAHATVLSLLGVHGAEVDRATAASHGAAALVLAWVGRASSRPDGSDAPPSSRARARPAYFWISLLVGLVGAEALRALSAGSRSSPLTLGVGVLSTAAMLWSIRVAPRLERGRPIARDVLIASATLALSGLPGAAPLGAALAALAWTGRRGAGAVRPAMLLAAPFELRAAWAAWVEAPGSPATPTLALALACAVPAAWLGASMLLARPDRWMRSAPGYLALLGAALLVLAHSLG